MPNLLEVNRDHQTALALAISRTLRDLRKATAKTVDAQEHYKWISVLNIQSRLIRATFPLETPLSEIDEASSQVARQATKLEDLRGKLRTARQA